MGFVRILSKGQMVIPVEIRKKFHIEPGTKMRIMEYGELICLCPSVKNSFNQSHGILPPQPSLSNKLLEERKKEFR